MLFILEKAYVIGQTIGRSRRTADDYITDLKATFHLALDLKIDGVVKSPIYCVVAIFQALGIPHVLPYT